jgi:hypothetical protein
MMESAGSFQDMSVSVSSGSNGCTLVHGYLLFEWPVSPETIGAKRYMLASKRQGAGRLGSMGSMDVVTDEEGSASAASPGEQRGVGRGCMMFGLGLGWGDGLLKCEACMYVCMYVFVSSHNICIGCWCGGGGGVVSYQLCTYIRMYVLMYLPMDSTYSRERERERERERKRERRDCCG